MSFASSFPGFRLRLTRWGGIFLVLTLVLGFAAVNTGNNALMAALGLGLATYVVSGTWSRQVLARTRVKVELAQEIFAGRATVVDVEITNGSRLFPAYGLVLRNGEGEVVVVETLIPAGATRRRTVETSFPTRGWLSLRSWRLEVLLPLSFFLKSKEVLGDREILVLPRILSSAGATAHAGGGADHVDQWHDRGREGEITQLREYREGDELRQIHWKQSARQQRMITVDRERPSQPPVVFVIEPRVSDPEDERVLARFERVVSEVATAVLQRLERGSAVGVAAGSTVVGPIRQRRHLGLLLRPLAEIEALPMDAEVTSREVFPGATAVKMGLSR